MKQLDAHCRRLLLVFAAALFAVSVCAAQDQTKPTAAPDKDKTATTATTTTTVSKVEEELAKTPSGKTVAKFFRAFNSGDIKQMRAFHESQGGDIENAEKDLDFFEKTGGLELHSLTSADKGEIAVLAQAKQDARWITIKFILGAEPPHAINGINVRPATAPAN
jgi:hypothetical protein